MWSLRAGDWSCAQCNFHNFSSKTECHKCGADKCVGAPLIPLSYPARCPVSTFSASFVACELSQVLSVMRGAWLVAGARPT